MGILNVTPDSFSDGGQWVDVQTAVQHGLEMAQAGAQIIDVGGESTRPGSPRVPAEEQLRRVVPVIERLRSALEKSDGHVAISIDTTRCSVARAALEAGASILNDVSAGRDDPNMFDLAAQRSTPLVLMHMQGAPQTMQDNPTYDDVIGQVEAFLIQRTQAATAAGVPRAQLILDPGIGFGKTHQHNLLLLAHLGRFVATGHPVLLGTSRKRFMRAICQGSSGSPTPTSLVSATCATTALGVAAGVSIFRVHDVQANRHAADVTWAVLGSRTADHASELMSNREHQGDRDGWSEQNQLLHDQFP